MRRVFERDDCDVYFVFNGTAANALALSAICRSTDAVVCHAMAHINVDECGAPEFWTGGAKLLTDGRSAREGDDRRHCAPRRHAA